MSEGEREREPDPNGCKRHSLYARPGKVLLAAAGGPIRPPQAHLPPAGPPAGPSPLPVVAQRSVKACDRRRALQQAAGRLAVARRAGSDAEGVLMGGGDFSGGG